ncbi:hypothetical protein EUX98_g4375 [Antrodiella citrinella]|uniref:Ribosome biogenesis protein NOP53 n=1 Tax=Antrodiella citrinella TaxID=2447956 RepID=A0A4S4MU67_9APHY|nr:hypothetical protein EUX98_g4375 [Antrodiella citrinella]
MRKGPFNSVIDPTEMGAGSALLEVSEAVKNSGDYDVWIPKEIVEEVVGNVPGKKLDVKQPNTPHPRALIALSAVPAPHEGTSYNPSADSHLSLLHEAHQVEDKRVKDAEQLKQMKDKIIAARRLAAEDEVIGAPGMTVDIPGADAVDEESDGSQEKLTKKLAERKTKKERLKAAKRRAEKRALEEKVAQKRMLATISMAKSFRKSFKKTNTQRERETLERQKDEAEKQKKDVQLGEDLSESFRALKPEGNLFRDRFLNMQHRALIEPRVPVIPNNRGKAKTKEYEKHAYKRFDRDGQ